MRMIVNRLRYSLFKHSLRYKKESKLLSETVKQLESMDLSEKKNACDFTKKLNKVSRNVIVDNVGMANLSLIMYLLNLKYDGEFELEELDNDCIIKIEGSYLAKMSDLAVYIHFIEVRESTIRIEGNISLPSIFKDCYTFGIKNNGENITCTMYDRDMDLKKGKNTYEIRTAYCVDIPLNSSKNKIIFSNYINGHECEYGKINAMRFSPVADCIKNQYCVRGKWLLYIERNGLYCLKIKQDKIEYYEKKFRQTIYEQFPSEAEWVISLRDEYFIRLKKKNKPIWLFIDRTDKADDNAEVLYNYVKKYDEIDSYFVIEKGTKDYYRLKNLGNIVELYSREHFLLVMLADYIISSQANGTIENPFWQNAEFFRDLYHQAKIIFLQHGVIKDNMSQTLNRYHTNFTGFITSSKTEWQSIIEYPYYYTENEVWLTGLPRFDLLYDDSKNYIVIMPSWRQGLMKHEWDNGKKDMIWTVREDFKESEYLKKYCSLINNKELNMACSKYGYQLVFMPHVLIEPYIDCFINESNCLYWDKNKSYREAFAEGKLLITDYSSVAFDFAYFGKPTLPSQFDKDIFFAEHTYTQGYYDYEKNGFGEVAYEETKLVKTIIKYMENDCKIKEKYRARIENTFEYHDKNCCERVFEHIISHN